MRIALIEPRPSEANVYSRLPMPLLGPLYLGAILKRRGHDVEVCNENFAPVDYGRLEADLVGISILTSTAQRGYEIARTFPRDKVVIGGVHASLVPDEASRYARQVVVGEAEGVIADIVEGRRTEPIVRGAPVEDLDALPRPDFSLIRGFPGRFRYPAPIIPISTSRGCPYDCSFCSVTKVFGRRYRFRSADSVIGELMARPGKASFFADDNFTANPSRTRRLLNLMIERGIGNWSCQVRCEAAQDKDLLELMAKAGCRVVCVGLESINPKTLHDFQKKQTVSQIVSAIRSFHRRKIMVHGMFVLGGDDDSEKTVWETVRFAIREKIDTLQMSILTPFPGTRVHELLERQKRIFTRDWSLYDGQHIVFKPRLLSAKELQMSVLRAYSKFYSLRRSLALLFTWRFRNAFFRLIGYSIVAKWKGCNRKMRWLAN